MAKRFTDTRKWNDAWWTSLSNDYRMVWQYILDNCTNAGIFEKNFRLMNFQCGVSFTEEEFKEVFKTRVIDCGKFFFVPKFLRFQYPKGLNSNKPAIVSVRNELLLNNLIHIVKESLGNDFLIVKDKDKDKDKDKEKEKDTDKEYITVENEKIYDPKPLLEYYEASLNARQKEHGCRNWHDVVPEWFSQNNRGDFNDQKHVMNSFSKYLINSGKPPNGKAVKKLTLKDLDP